MSSVAAPEVVRPAHFWIPEGAQSPWSDDAAQLAADAGLILDPEQKLILDVMLAEQPSGQPVFEACVVEARQNGKTWALMAAVLYDLLIAEDKLIVWSAHEFSTAMRTFKDFKALIAQSNALDSRLMKVNNANGDEGFEFRGGQELRFRARTKAGGRGLAGDKVILDEAFALDDAHMGALMPILTTRPNAQVRYASSAGLAKSEVLRGIRDRGRSGKDPSLGYVEWCSTAACATEDCDHSREAVGCAADNVDGWLAANPGVQRRRDDWRQHIGNERRALPPAEFVRERLGWWDDPGGSDYPYPWEKWSKLEDASSVLIESEPVFFIDTNPIRSYTAVSVAGMGREVVHVELVKYEPGTAWVVGKVREWLEEWPDATVGMLKDGAAASLVPEFERADVNLELMDSRSYVAACGSMFDAIVAGSFRHIGQQHLNDALVSAKKRELEGAWALARKHGDISPIVSAVCARHLYASRDVGAPLIAYR